MSSQGWLKQSLGKANNFNQASSHQARTCGTFPTSGRRRHDEWTDSGTPLEIGGTKLEESLEGIHIFPVQAGGKNISRKVGKCQRHHLLRKRILMLICLLSLWTSKSLEPRN